MKSLLLLTAIACSKPGAPTTPIGSIGSDAPIVQDKLVGDGGVGPIHDATTAEALAALFPGKTAKTDHQEAEAYNFDVITVDDLEIVAKGSQLFKVTVVGGAWATAEGVSTASTIGAVAAKYPDLACAREHYDPNPEDFTEALICKTSKYARLSFYVDPAAVTTIGPVAISTIADKKLQMIIWMANPGAD